MKKILFTMGIALSAGFASAQASFLDPNFATNGIFLSNIGGDSKPRPHMTLLSDGKILVVGHDNLEGTVTRLLPNGQPDPAFGNNGTVRIAYPYGDGTQSHYINLSAAVIFKERIIVGGISGQYAIDSTLLVALKPDGRIDSAFGTYGHKQFNFSGEYHTEFVMAMQKLNDNEFLAAGYSMNPQSLAWDSEMLLAKFDKNGNPVSSFGTNGHLLTGHATQQEIAYAFTTDAGGNIYLAGSTALEHNNRPHSHAMVIKVKPNGVPDPSFGVNSMLSQSFHPEATTMRSPTDEWYSIALQNNKLVLAGGTGEGSRGSSGSGVQADVIMQRIDLNGNIDPSFGNAGLARDSIRSFSSGSRAGYIDRIIITADNKIQVSGSVLHDLPDSSNDYLRPFAARFSANGFTDASFGASGVMLMPDITTLTGTITAEPTGLILATDGSIYQCGYATQLSNIAYKLFVVKYKGSGTTAIGTRKNTDLACEIYPTFLQAGGSVTLKLGAALPEAAYLHLTDISGRQIRKAVLPEGSTTGTMRLPATVAPGMYLLRLSAASGDAVGKIMVR